MQGVGLWGPIWGYISLESDFNTVYGTYFDHKGETPGLGAEIAEKPFNNSLKAKRLWTAIHLFPFMWPKRRIQSRTAPNTGLTVSRRHHHFSRDGCHVEKLYCALHALF
jgi:Na+-transporting NADH:ubiquinone oxidoreductase subunit NqrC